jgi:hypothetical protein
MLVGCWLLMVATAVKAEGVLMSFLLEEEELMWWW